MTKKLKKAFTLVELVIVIAVVAILAAVLIPTFTSLVNKASESFDIALAKNMNTILSTTYGDSTPETMDEVYKLMEDQGFIMENITPRASGNLFVWDEKNNEMLYIDSDSVVLYANSYTAGEELTLKDTQYMWMTISTASQVGEFRNYSLYLVADITLDESTQVYSSVDTGVQSLTGEIEYVYSQDNEFAKFRGTIESLVVNNAKATVYNYSNLTTLTINAVASSSYHEYGYVKTFNVKTATEGDSSNIVIEQCAIVEELTITSVTENGTVITNYGEVSTVASATTAKIENEGYIAQATSTSTLTITTGEVETTVTSTSALESALGEAPTTEIYSYLDLINFRDKVNAGVYYTDRTIELKTNIDLTGRGWTPIGNVENLNIAEGASLSDIITEYSKNIIYFGGTFNGNGYTITGLSNVGFEPTTTRKDGASEEIETFFGFFGITYNATITDLNFEEVAIDKFEDSNIELGSAGTLIGYALDSVTVENVNVKSGTINALNGIGGLVGRIYSIDMVYYASNNVSTTSEFEISFTNCSNNADIINTTHNSAGLVGFICNSSTKGNQKITFENCTNSGDLTSVYESGTSGSYKNIAQIAIIYYAKSGDTLTLTNCTTTGTLTYADGSVDSSAVCRFASVVNLSITIDGVTLDKVATSGYYMLSNEDSGWTFTSYSY